MSKNRALVVEDERSWQQIVSELLTDAGLAVDVAATLEEAAACLKAAPHRLAVVDLSLGGRDHYNQDGLRVLDAVQRLDPGCATMLLTGFATVELAVSAVTEHGAHTCLRKETFNRSEFRALVNEILAGAPPLEAAACPLEEEVESTPAATDVDEVEAVPPGLALVVEDDAGWRSILAELLADAGYEVRLCASYGEALGCLRREKYTLAVVDLSLTAPPGEIEPGGLRTHSAPPLDESFEGYRLLASTRARNIPTVVVSGVAVPEAIEQAYAEQGIFTYLEKQAFSRRAFIETVAAARASGGVTDLVKLTDREREVLELLAQGMTNKEIAAELVITTNTVKRHLKAIFRKLDVHTRAAAAAKAANVWGTDL
jgi:DNA-binding NarL/FixJ family response regulator